MPWTDGEVKEMITTGDKQKAKEFMRFARREFAKGMDVAWIGEAIWNFLWRLNPREDGEKNITDLGTDSEELHMMFPNYFDSGEKIPRGKSRQVE